MTKRLWNGQLEMEFGGDIGPAAIDPWHKEMCDVEKCGHLACSRLDDGRLVCEAHRRQPNYLGEVRPLRAAIGRCDVIGHQWDGSLAACSRDGSLGSDGVRLCRTHRQLMTRGAEFDELRPLERRESCDFGRSGGTDDTSKCGRERTSMPFEVNGERLHLCEAHGAQVRTTGRLKPLRQRGPRPCDGPECVNQGRYNIEIDGHQLYVCSGHGRQHENGKDLSPLRKLRSRGTRASRDSQGLAHCARCDQWLPEGEFPPSLIGQICRKCNSVRTREWKYNLTGGELLDMYVRQEGRCDLCLEPAEFGELVVDHDHACCPGDRACGNCVRALVHSNCNTGIGLLKNFRTFVYAACYSDMSSKDLEWAERVFRAARAVQAGISTISALEEGISTIRALQK